MRATDPTHLILFELISLTILGDDYELQRDHHTLTNDQSKFKICLHGSTAATEIYLHKNKTECLTLEFSSNKTTRLGFRLWFVKFCILNLFSKSDSFGSV